MAPADISRSAFDPRKHYANVGMQQGRVIVDDDWNENERILAEDRRRSLVDLIGPHGSPDGGFRVTNVRATDGVLDFDIQAGAFYLGGARLELEQAETYREQRDWLQFAADVATPSSGRIDLVYLESWEQPVTAVEDEELFEVALGGPDTSTRTRRMRRVRVLQDLGTTDCGEAWQTAALKFAANGEGSLAADGEMVTNCRLAVTLSPGTTTTDPCETSITGGYIGAENQAIRVQIVEPGSFTWGFDNAAPLYRATAAADGVTLTLVTEPKDQAHWPLAGDTVEILPWSSVLVNGEKLAEAQGHLTTLASSYNPDDREITLSDALSSGFGSAWKSRSDASLLGDEFVFVRVWHRGGDRTGSAAVSFTPGTAVALGETGVSVTLDELGRAGDFWVIAVRPNTPNKVVPWELEVGRAPHGPNSFRAPLALVRWADGGAGIAPQVISDCRERFAPLTRLETCSTYVVGDGVHSHGNFTTIQEAVDALPLGGGEVHVLPGRYMEEVVIRRRNNVTIHGCGRRTLVVTPGDSIGAAFLVQDSVSVSIGDLAIRSDEGTGVNLESQVAALSLKKVNLQAETGILLQDLVIRVRDGSAVSGRGVNNVTVKDCDIVVLALAEDLDTESERGRWPAVFLTADDLVIEDNTITTRGAGARRTALGGIQIGGGSDRVGIARNVIQGGNGNGITLGSILYLPDRSKDLPSTDYAGFLKLARRYPTGASIILDEKGCVRWTPQPVPPDDDAGNPMVPASEGSLTQVEIVGNRISGTAGNGISVVHFFDPTERPDCVTVSGLVIRDNRIIGCLQGEVAESSTSAMTYSGFGGIALAGVIGLEIRHNWIERNGLSHIDPVCGIFVLYAEGAAIDDNVITGNGPRVGSQSQPRAGNRGGIVIGLATSSDGASSSSGGRAARISGLAARIHRNRIAAPEGRALKLTALGDIVVQSNDLTTDGYGARRTHGVFNEVAVGGILRNVSLIAASGLSAALTDLAGGAAVWISNLGTTSEVIVRDDTDQKLVTGQVAGVSVPAGSGAETATSGAAGSATSTSSAGSAIGSATGSAIGDRAQALGRMRKGGAVLFSGNRVRLALARGEVDPPPSAVVIISNDDISAQDNQIKALVPPTGWFINTLVHGMSVRVIGNRFEELLGSAADEAMSAVTIGRTMNVTTGNEGTHCIYARGAAANSTVRLGNVSLVEMVSEHDAPCATCLADLDELFKSDAVYTLARTSWTNGQTGDTPTVFKILR